MSVITLNIVESAIQVVQGVPLNVTLSTASPTTIFYTLDGSQPTLDSLIVVGPINLNIGGNGVILKAFATDGTDTSPIITQIYGTVENSDTRRPRDKVTGLNNTYMSLNPGIFGSNIPNPNIIWGNIGGNVVDQPNVTNIPDGYAGLGDGTRSNGTDQPLENYQFIHTTTNYLGETGRGIGTLPSIKLLIPSPPPTSSDTSKKLFNPRALVIIQDGTKPPEDPNLVMLNRADFSLSSIDGNGTEAPKTGMEGAVTTGAFVKQFYNPRDQTVTYYYHDSKSLRWIISKEQYVIKNPNIFNYSLMIMPSRGGAGSKYVYGWKPFQRRVLF